MKTYEHFPQDGRTFCPVCGTDEDRTTFLVPLDGTDKGDREEAVPIHVDCITGRLDELRCNQGLGFIYMRAYRDHGWRKDPVGKQFGDRYVIVT